MNKILSIVIPVYNKYAFTKSCLNDLSNLSNDYEIIVVDNLSTDETQKQLENSKEIIYFRNHQNSMFSGGCNIGYALSSGENICFLNNDIRIKDKENWSKPLLEKCKDYLVGPTMGLLDKNFNFVKEANEYLTGNSYISGWCIASSRDNWNKLEMPRTNELNYKITIPQIWDENFFYFSDPDLCLRAQRLGIKMTVATIPVVHFGKISSKELNVQKLYKDGRDQFLKKWK